MNLPLLSLLVAPLLVGACGDPAAEGEERGIGGLFRGAVERPNADSLIAAGQNWRAARQMRRYLDRTGDPEAHDLLVAARAEGGWGGWARVAELLEGQTWLDDEGDGIGWYLLGRAHDEREEYADAVIAYRRFLQVGGEELEREREIANLRLGLSLLRSGTVEEGRAAVERANAEVSGIERWTPLLMTVAVAETGDTAETRRLGARYDSGIAGLRVRRARLHAARQAGDLAAVRDLARQFRGWAGTASTRAEFLYDGSRAAEQMGDLDAARSGYRGVIDEVAVTATGLRAARRLEALGSPTPRDRQALGLVYAAHGNHEEAVEHFRAAFEGGAATTGAERSALLLSLADAQIDAEHYDDAIETLTPLTEGTGDTARRAMQLLARAHGRAGRHDRSREVYHQVARRFPAAGVADAALYFAADQAHEARELDPARADYRRVMSQHRGSTFAGLSAMRLAGLEYEQGDYARAVEVWEAYRSAYPRGANWLQATYWAGRAYDEMGQEERAAERYRAVRSRDRISYYALRASERLGVDFWPVPMGSGGGATAGARQTVAGWMEPVDFLRDAGFHEEARAEADRVASAAGSGIATQYALAEALIERGYAQRGIRIGTALEGRQGRNPHNLRLQFPLAYRDLIEAEAAEQGLDPFVVAALIRQESLFEERATSHVGARGLMQVMPETGRRVAEDLGVEEWDPDLLYNPEVSIHIGTTYLSWQMESYDGSLPSVFSAYNAGSHRVDAWQSFPEYGREELFTERIPFRETRDYVKILTRNLAVYRGLYGGEE